MASSEVDYLVYVADLYLRASAKRASGISCHLVVVLHTLLYDGEDFGRQSEGKRLPLPGRQEIVPCSLYLLIVAHTVFLGTFSPSAARTWVMLPYDTLRS